MDYVVSMCVRCGARVQVSVGLRQGRAGLVAPEESGTKEVFWNHFLS